MIQKSKWKGSGDKTKWKGSGDKTRRNGLPLLSIDGVQLCHFFMRAGACPHEAKVCAGTSFGVPVRVCACVRVCGKGVCACACVSFGVRVRVCSCVRACAVKVCGEGVCACARVSLSICVSYTL